MTTSSYSTNTNVVPVTMPIARSSRTPAVLSLTRLPSKYEPSSASSRTETSLVHEIAKLLFPSTNLGALWRTSVVHNSETLSTKSNCRIATPCLTLLLCPIILVHPPFVTMTTRLHLYPILRSSRVTPPVPPEHHQ